MNTVCPYDDVTYKYGGTESNSKQNCRIFKLNDEHLREEISIRIEFETRISC